MFDWLADIYLWSKSLHVIAVITWMAGLFYLPRLFVYHAERVEIGSDTDEMFKTMEHLLLKAIMNPAMVVSWVAGIWLAWEVGLLSDWPVWFVVKFLCLILMSGFHMWLAAQVKVFARDANERGHVAFRVANELPTALMVVIVVMVIVKPFV